MLSSPMRMAGAPGLLLTALLVGGCGGGGSAGSNPAPPAPAPVPTPTPTSEIHGTATGNGAPLAGASVAVYAAGASGYGTGATLLGTATSDALGNWTVGLNCPPDNPQLYAIATASTVQNSAGRLLAALGRCGDAVASATTVNELTTVAAAYALAQFFNVDGQQIGAPDTNRAGLANAAGLAMTLVDPVTGQLGLALASSPVPAETINTLASVLAACVASAGAASTPCLALFDAATVPGASAPTTALQAALSVTRNPASQVDALYRAVPSTPRFQPVLAAAPNDWMLQWSLRDPAMERPLAIAIDAEGSAWVASYGSAVVKFDANGRIASPSGGYTGGGLRESFGIAVDRSGNVWLTNEVGTSAAGNRFGSVTRLGPDGTVLSGAAGYTGGGINYPIAITIDQDGTALVANFGGSTVTRLAADGVGISPATGFEGGGIAFPVSVALDAAGSIWTANKGGDSVSLLGSSGTALSPDSGFGRPDLAAPDGLCIDSSGSVWVMNYLGDSVVELRASDGGAAGTALSPANGYSGGGIWNPSRCAIDGGGNIWISNYTGASLSRLAGRRSPLPGSPLSPASGFASGALSQPRGMAIDASGNLWVASSGDNAVALFPGATAPVRTPLIGLPVAP